MFHNQEHVWNLHEASENVHSEKNYVKWNERKSIYSLCNFLHSKIVMQKEKKKRFSTLWEFHCMQNSTRFEFTQDNKCLSCKYK